MNKTIRKITALISIFFTGSLLSSLWITKSENWRIYLPIILICISWNIYSREFDED